VYSPASARAVIDVGKRRVEMSIGVDEIRHAVRSQIHVHIIDVHSISQDVIWEDGAVTRVGGAALVPRQHSADGHAQCDIRNIIRQPPAVRETGRVASEQSKAAGAGGRCGRHSGVQAQQVGDGSWGRTRSGNGRQILHEWQEVGPGSGG